MDMSVVPIINENDTVATDEIRFGDNDTLGALVANLIEADLLIILTDVAGLLSADPRVDPAAKRIESALATDQSLTHLVSKGAGALGRGGMVTKLGAARLAARSGAHTLIASGEEPKILTRILDGEDLGTCCSGRGICDDCAKALDLGQLPAKGDIVIDNGAVHALRQHGVSLLAVGILGVRGDFRRGDVVRCLDRNNEVIAQGLSNYGLAEVEAIKGLGSDAYSKLLDTPQRKKSSTAIT